MQLPDPPLMTGYANWHSGEVESLVPVGSIPTSVTDKEHDPVVQGQRRLGDNQESAGSIPAGITDTKWSVGVLAAHLLGKEEDPVQLRDGPLGLDGLACSQEATDPCKVGEVGSTPIRSTQCFGLMVQRDDTALAWRRSEFDSRSVH